MHKKYRYIIPVVALLLCVVCQRMIGKGVDAQATRSSSSTTTAIECPRQSAKTPQQIIHQRIQLWKIWNCCTLVKLRMFTPCPMVTAC